MPTPGIGHLSYVQIGRESTFGTAVAATHKLEIVSQSLSPVIGVIRDPSLNNQPSRRGLYKGGQLIRGTIVTRLNYAGQELLWDSLFGTATFGTKGATSVGAGNPYLHPFKEGDLLNSLTLELAEGNIAASTVQRVVGAIVTGVVVRATAGNNESAMLTAEWSFIGVSKGTGATATGALTAATPNPVLYHQAQIIDDGINDASINTTATIAGSVNMTAVPATPWALITVGMKVFGVGIAAGTTVSAVPSSGLVTLSSAATASASGVLVTFGVATPTVRMRNFECSIQNNVTEDRFYLGSANIDQPLRGDFIAASMRLGFEFNTVAVLTAAAAFTTGSPELRFSDGAATPAVFRFRMSEAVLTDYSNPVAGYGVLLASASWEGFRTSTNNDTSAAYVELVNANAGSTF